MTSWAITYSDADFGVTAAGEPVRRWSIDDGEISVGVLDLGGIIQSMHLPDRSGQREDIMLGFDDVAGYESTKTFCGALIGRLANRLTQGRFDLDDVEYQITQNEGDTALHGGVNGFHRRIWSVEPFSDDTGAGLRLALTSPDGDQGFPGKLEVTVDYLLVPGRRRLKIRYRAVTDAPTVLNLTHHAYFNLGGQVLSKPTLDGHVLQVCAGHYTPVDGRGLPSGEIAHVTGTAFDLRSPQPLDFLTLDHNLVLDEPSRNNPVLPWAAALEHPATGRRMEVLTSEPGLQVYTGAGLDGTEVGKGGVHYQRGAAICLESQHFPDAPNHKEFPSTVLRPGEAFTSRTEWRFSTT